MGSLVEVARSNPSQVIDDTTLKLVPTEASRGHNVAKEIQCGFKREIYLKLS